MSENWSRLRSPAYKGRSRPLAITTVVHLSPMMLLIALITEHSLRLGAGVGSTEVGEVSEPASCICSLASGGGANGHVSR